MGEDADAVEAMKWRLARMTEAERDDWLDVVKHGAASNARRLDPWSKLDRAFIELSPDPMKVFVVPLGIEIRIPAKEFAKRVLGTEWQLGLDDTEPGEA